MTATFPGDIGKPRPAIIMQADEYIDGHRTLLLCPMTTFPSDAAFFRPAFYPTLENGLKHRSEAMIDKITPVRKDGIGQKIGVASHLELLQLELGLITIAGLDRYLVIDEPLPEGL